MLIRLLLISLLGYTLLSAADTAETTVAAPEGIKLSSEKEKESYTKAVAKEDSTVISKEALGAAAKAADNNTTETSAGRVIIKDSSGLSEDTVRDIAKETDKEETVKTLKKAAKVKSDPTTSDSVKEARIEAVWEDMAPTPNEYDWIQMTSREWLKGDFKSLYNDELTFDSDKMDLQTFDFDDVRQIRTHHIVTVNIDGLAVVTGILRLKEDKAVIIQGDGKLEFNRDQIVSIAFGGEKELNYWTGSVGVSYSMQSGNTDQSDYVANLHIERNTAKTRLQIDYIGNISEHDNDRTANNHRINEQFDVLLTRNLFWMPLLSELYKDEFQNLALQVTAGPGLGYKIIDNDKVTWEIAAGPAAIYTRLDQASGDEEDSTLNPAFVAITILSIEVTNDIDFDFNYRSTYTDDEAGRYIHHIVTTFSDDLTDWLTLDLSFYWDRIQDPAQHTDGSYPDQDDYKTTVGFSIDF